MCVAAAHRVTAITDAWTWELPVGGRHGVSWVVASDGVTLIGSVEALPRGLVLSGEARCLVSSSRVGLLRARPPQARPAEEVILWR